MIEKVKKKNKLGSEKILLNAFKTPCFKAIKVNIKNAKASSAENNTRGFLASHK